jgi:hypothetical protein
LKHPADPTAWQEAAACAAATACCVQTFWADRSRVTQSSNWETVTAQTGNCIVQLALSGGAEITA